MNAERLVGLVGGLAIGFVSGVLLMGARAERLERQRQSTTAEVLEWNEAAAKMQFRSTVVGQLRIVHSQGHDYIAGEKWAKHADNCAACVAKQQSKQ